MLYFCAVFVVVAELIHNCPHFHCLKWCRFHSVVNPNMMTSM